RMQADQHKIDDALNARRTAMIRAVDRHRQCLRLRFEKDTMTVAALARVLQRPRSADKGHIAALKDFIRSIVREQLGGIPLLTFHSPERSARGLRTTTGPLRCLLGRTVNCARRKRRVWPVQTTSA